MPIFAQFPQPKQVHATQVTLTPDEGGREITLLYQEGESHVSAHCGDNYLSCPSESVIWTPEQAMEAFQAKMDTLSLEVQEAFLEG